MIKCSNCGKESDFKEKTATLSLDEEVYPNFFEIFMRKKYIFCSFCNEIDIIKHKVIRLISYREIDEVIDKERLASYLKRREFLTEILGTLNKSRYNWTLFKSLKNGNLTKTQIQANLWNLYEIGLIHVKCHPIKSKWKSSDFRPKKQLTKLDTIIMEQKAFISSVSLTTFGRHITEYLRDLSGPDVIDYKQKILFLMNSSKKFTQSVEDPRLLEIKKILMLIRDHVKSNEVFSLNSKIYVDRYPERFEILTRFLIETFFIIQNKKIKTSSQICILDDYDESERSVRRSSARLDAKNVLLLPLIVYNIFQEPNHKDEQIRTEFFISELFRTIRKIERNLRELILEILLSSTYLHTFSLWQTLPNSIKFGIASKKTFSVNKIPDNEYEQSEIVNKAFPDPRNLLEVLLKNSFLSDLGRIILSKELYSKHFNSFFKPKSIYKKSFDQLNKLRNVISHANIPDSSSINLGLKSAYLIMIVLRKS